MLVRMKTPIAGANWSADAGQEVEINPEDAKRLINAGYAVEVAIVGAKENAALRTRPPRRGKEKR